MKHALCIEFRENAARLVQAGRHGAEYVVQVDQVVTWTDSADPRQRGKQLAAALAPHKLGKLPVVAAFPRERLVWQTFELPPAPAADLPDLVHLQTARELASDDQTILDFLPLEGDAEQPYRVLTVVDRRGRLAEARAICAAAGLQLEAAVPTELGWPRLCPPGSTGDEQTPAFGVAIGNGQAMVWVLRGEQLHRLRTCRLPTSSPEAAAQALGGELRRTALAEQLPPDATARWLLLVDESTAPIADAVGPQLPGDVDVVGLAALYQADHSPVPLSAENAPLAALAGELALGNRPRIDLLHPRRRPEPPSRMRRLALAATAAIVVAAGVGWQGYQNLQAPLVEAEAAQAEIDQLAPMVEALAEDVARRDQVAEWQAAAPNLLEQLAEFSQQLRPTPLESDDFPQDLDATLTRLSQNNDSFTLTAAIRSAAAAQAVERRLRDADRRVARQRLESLEDGPAGYSQRLVVAVEKDASAAGADKEAP